MAFAAPAQASGTPRAAGAQAHGLSRPEGMSPAAQALAAKKPSGFLQLFRRISGAANGTGRPAGGRKAPGEVPSGPLPAQGVGSIPAVSRPRAFRPGGPPARGAKPPGAARSTRRRRPC